MTLTDDTGREIQLHPIARAMVELIVSRQEGIWRRPAGIVQLHFSAPDVSMKVFDPPVFTAFQKTVDKPRPV